MRWKELNLLAVLVFILLIVSCSSSETSVTLPDEPREATEKGRSSHSLWGLWDVMYDINTNTMEFIPLRGADFHLNVLPFLEPPVLVNVTLETAPDFDPILNTVTVDIGLTHPFEGATEFAGFDVKGIVISHADYPGFIPSNSFKMPGINRLRCLNGDGYTRMWNPVEFPYNPDYELFTYKPGLLGAPDDQVQFDSQLNGFKYFCDGLLPGDPVTSMNLAMRGVFTPGTKNVRTYILSMPQGLLFQYAVDASWEFPLGPGHPWIIPDDYPITANSPEAYFIDYTTDGVMFAGNVPGTYNMEITVYDHQPGSIQQVLVEAAQIYTGSAWVAAFEYTTTYGEVWSVSLDNYNMVAAGTYPGLISVVDETMMNYLSPFPINQNFTAYRTFEIEVLPTPGVIVTLEEDAAIKGHPGYTSTPYSYDTVYFDDVMPPHDCGYFTNPNGPWEFSYVYTDVVTVGSLDAVPPDPEVSGFAGLYPGAVTHFWKGATRFGDSTIQPYLGEMHDFAEYKRLIYGVTESVLLGGTYIFTDEDSLNAPMEFTYPYYYGTNFTTIGRYLIPPPPIPIEIFELKWSVKGIGEGDLKLDPGGTTYSALLLRHDLTVEIGDSEFAQGIIYEWMIDDGHTLAMISAGNTGGDNNFDQASGFIYGDSMYMVLQGY